jgi:hypothetical protein
MVKLSYQKQLEKYRKEAYNYFSQVNISPIGEDIVEYVCQCVEDESGCDVDDDGYKGIAKRLKITL